MARYVEKVTVSWDSAIVSWDSDIVSWDGDIVTQWTICGNEDVFMTSSPFQAQDHTKTSLEPNIRSKMKTTKTSIGRHEDVMKTSL